MIKFIKNLFKTKINKAVINESRISLSSSYYNIKRG